LAWNDLAPAVRGQLATIDVSTTQGDPVRYQLLSLPIYLAWRAIDAASRVTG
jgi:predicted small integral membrane protein